MADGQYAEFVEWSDGDLGPQKTMSYNPSSLIPGQQDILDFHACYRIVSSPGSWEPTVNIGSVEIGNVVAQGGFYPEGVHKDQCVDKFENMFIAWCETDGVLHVQGLDLHLNSLWGEGGLVVDSPSGGGRLRQLKQ